MSTLGFLFSLYNESFATLSSVRSGESCLSKDKRETPLTSSTEINQTRKLGRNTRKVVCSSLILDLVVEQV